MSELERKFLNLMISHSIVYKFSNDKSGKKKEIE